MRLGAGLTHGELQTFDQTFTACNNDLIYYRLVQKATQCSRWLYNIMQSGKRVGIVGDYDVDDVACAVGVDAPVNDSGFFS
jgi:hypothetical protein